MATTWRLEVSIDNFPLNDMSGNRHYVIDTQPVVGGMQRRGIDVVIPGADGVMPYYAETVEATQYGIRIGCLDAPGQTAYETMRHIVGIFNNPQAHVITKTVNGITTMADCKLSAVTEPVRNDTGDGINFTLVLSIPGAWFRDTLVQNWSQLPPVSGTEYPIAWTKDSVAQIQDAQIKVTGPMTTPVLTDMGSGAKLTLPSIASGYQIIIDTSTGVAVMQPTSTDWSFAVGTDYTSQVRGVGPGSSLRLFVLTPRKVNLFLSYCYIKITTTGMSGSSRLEVRGQRCLL